MDLAWMMALIWGGCGWVFGIIGWRIAYDLLKSAPLPPSEPSPAPPKEAEVEAAPAPEEVADAARRALLSEYGKKGAAISAEMRVEREVATKEAMSLISEYAPAALAGQLNDEQKATAKGKFYDVIRAHPRVAEAVARKLNREMGISKFFGMSEDSLLAEVAQVVMSAAPQPSSGAALAGDIPDGMLW